MGNEVLMFLVCGLYAVVHDVRQSGGVVLMHLVCGLYAV